MQLARHDQRIAERRGNRIEPAGHYLTRLAPGSFATEQQQLELARLDVAVHVDVGARVESADRRVRAGAERGVVEESLVHG